MISCLIFILTESVCFVWFFLIFWKINIFKSGNTMLSVRLAFIFWNNHLNILKYQTGSCSSAMLTFNQTMQFLIIAKIIFSLSKIVSELLERLIYFKTHQLLHHKRSYLNILNSDNKKYFINLWKNPHFRFFFHLLCFLI